MKLHWWVEFRGRGKLVLFLLTLAVVIVSCTLLPSEAWHLRRRQLVPTPATASSLWLAGWFLLLFVRAEDLHLSAPFNFQAACRLLGGALIGVGLLFGIFLFVAHA